MTTIYPWMTRALEIKAKMDVLEKKQRALKEQMEGLALQAMQEEHGIVVDEIYSLKVGKQTLTGSFYPHLMYYASPYMFVGFHERNTADEELGTRHMVDKKELAARRLLIPAPAEAGEGQ